MSTRTRARSQKARDEGRQTAAERKAEKEAALLPSALPPVAAAALVFVAAGAVLMLEILAVRLLAPYVGLTLETTTSIIGAALGGIAAGAAIGGYFADRTDTRRLVVGLLVGGGLLALLIVPLVRWLGPGARGEGDLAALGITLVALVPAAATLSAVSPAVAHLQLHDLRASGTIVGRLSAWATAGALVGTFGTGFVLVPIMPVSSAVLAIGAVLVLTGIALGTTSRLLSLAGVTGVAVAAIVMGGWANSFDSPCERETVYNCIYIEADPTHPGGYHLKLDDGYHSYVDVKDPTHLAYSYSRWIADAVNAMEPKKSPLDMLIVGGGGFTLPRWIDATRPGSHSQVLELDDELVDYVEDWIDLPPPAALGVTAGDARISMLDEESNSADVIVDDAFSHHTMPWHLTTAEWTNEVERVLRPDGLYAVNVIDFPPLNLLGSELATLLDSFSNVWFVAFPDSDGQPAGANAVLFAADQRFPRATGSQAEGAISFNQQTAESLAEGKEILHDDFAPVDQLVTLPG